MYKFYIIMLLAFITSCQNREQSDTASFQKDKEYGHGAQRRQRHRGSKSDETQPRIIYSRDTVFVPEESPVYSKLQTLTVHKKDIQVSFSTTGVVKPLSGHLAHVTTPFDGRVVRSFVKLGDKVAAGTPLFEVSSSDYLETVRACIQAGQQKELAEKNFRRKKELLESGVISKKEYDEALVELDLAEKECEKSMATLRIFNFSADEADLAKPLLVRSPIGGEIVFTNITTGQYLKSDDDPVVTVADLNKIWVVARVKEKDLGAINLNDNAEVFTEVSPDKPASGRVNYIGNIMDEQTRSVEVYLECKNTDRMLKPGMFITTRFYRQLKDAILIPSTAILQDNLNNYVYQRIADGTFIKKDIVSETNGHKDVLVKSGLADGDVIVTEGAIYLR